MKKIIRKTKTCNSCQDTCGGAVYGLGVIGALFYYVGTAPTFWMGVWGIIKAMLWPAFLVFETLKYLGM